MKPWSTGRVSALGLLFALGGGGALAQQAPTGLPPLPGTTPPAVARSTPFRGLRRVAFQNAPATVPPSPGAGPEAPAPTAEPGASAARPTDPGAPASSSTSASGDTSGSGLSLPRAEREGGGGEPTTAAATADTAAASSDEKKGDEPAAKDPTKLLMNAMGLEESPVKVYGWIQNSFTYNANGTPKNALNFGVNPNYLANRWMGNQYYLILENPLEQGDKLNFGFRIDNLFGNDWQFNHSHGFADTVAKLNHFNGYDLAQVYAEVHLPPVLSKGGTDIKGGRWYTIMGYEVVPAVGRPLLSVPYMFNYGQPFTHFGVMATTHVTDQVNWYNGAVNGWDRWINDTYKWNYMGGLTWSSKKQQGGTPKANLAFSFMTGPEQFPRFLPTNTVVVPTGTTPTSYLPGRRNPGYGGNWRTLFTTVFTYKWTDTLSQVLETDQGFEKNVPGFGPGGTPTDAEWYSFGNWFLWQFYKKGDRDVLTGVWRSEVFRDNNGVRTGFADNFYEITLGLIWKPKPYIWIRPEARYDWAQFTHPYNDGTRNSQFTLGVDAILLY